jgi:hypothetical protein
MYVVPAVGQLVFGDQIVSTYKIVPLTQTAFIEIVVVYGLFFFLSATKIPLLPALVTYDVKSIISRLGRLYLRIRLWVILVGNLLGLLLVFFGLNDFRYSNEAISEQEGWVVVLPLASLVWRMMAQTEAFYWIFVGKAPDGHGRRRWYWENVLLSMGLILTSNGIASLWVSLLTLAYALFPQGFRSIVLREANARRLKIGAKAVWTFCFAVIFMVAWYFGALIKVGAFGENTGLMQDTTGLAVMGFSSDGADRSVVSWAGLYLLERASIYYYSWTFTAATSWGELNRKGWMLGIPIRNFLFRLDYLLGGALGVERPEVGSFARLNYSLLTAGEIRTREGSTPGFLAAFNYAFPFPLNILFCALFLRWWCRQFDNLLAPQAQKRLTWFGVLVIFVLLQGLFQSPFDWLLILDEGVIMPLLLWVIAVAHRESRTSSVVPNTVPCSPNPALDAVHVNRA